MIPCFLKKKLILLLFCSRFVVKSFWSACNSVKRILKGHPNLLPDNVEADEGGEDFDGEGGEGVDQGAAVEEEGGGEWGLEEVGGEDSEGHQR